MDKQKKAPHPTAAGTPPRRRTERHDWEALRQEFAAGDTSLNGFARDHKMEAAWLKRRALADGWQRAREEFRARRDAKLNEAIIKEQAKQAVSLFRSSQDIRFDVHRIAGNVTQRIGHRLSIDPATKRPRETPKAAELKQLIETLRETFKLEMQTGEHALMPDRHEVSGIDGGPVEVADERTGLEGFSDAEVIRLARALLQDSEEEEPPSRRKRE